MLRGCPLHVTIQTSEHSKKRCVLRRHVGEDLKVEPNRKAVLLWGRKVKQIKGLANLSHKVLTPHT